MRAQSAYLTGFTPDGYCSEGMGYWNYGFGNYVELGALCRNATRGELDLFRFPKIRAVVRQTSLARAQRLAEEALRQTDPAAVRAVLAR